MATNNRKIQVYLKKEVDLALEEFKKAKRIETDSQAVNRVLSLFFKLENEDEIQSINLDSNFVTTSDYKETTKNLQSQIDLLNYHFSTLAELMKSETTSESLDPERLPETTSESMLANDEQVTTSDSTKITNDDDKLTRKDMAKLLNINPTTVGRWIRARKFEKFPNHYLWNPITEYFERIKP